MREDEKLIKIAKFENEFVAELAKSKLEDAGIESVVFGEEIGAIKPYTTTPFNVELQVFEKDSEKAKQILAEKETLEAQEGDE